MRKFVFTEHAAIRAEERYKLKLTPSAAIQILSLCGNAVEVKGRKDVFLVLYHKTPLLVALNKAHTMITSFIPFG